MASCNKHLFYIETPGSRKNAARNYSRPGISPVIVICLAILSLLSFNPAQLTAQSQNEPQLATHYIILIDTTTKSFRSRLPGETGNLGTWVVKAVKAAVENSAVVREPGFRPGVDFISLVFFHYPIKNRIEIGILPGPYLYTSPDLLNITDIDAAPGTINGFIINNKQRFELTRRSPIELTRLVVLPFLCGQFRNANILPAAPNHIGNIRLISIDDLGSDTVNHRDFKDRAEWARLARWKTFMKSNYSISSMHDGSVYRFDENSGNVFSMKTSVEGQWHFNYFEITPRLDNVRLEADDTIPMNRLAVRGSGNNVDLIWRRTDAIRFSTGTYNGYLEWSEHNAERNGGNRWSKLDNIGDPSRPVRIINYRIREGDNRIPLQINIPGNSGSSFKRQYRFRGVIRVKMPANGNPSYPFVYRHYTKPRIVTFTAAADSSTINNKELASRMKDSKYLEKVRRYWTKDPQLKAKYPAAVSREAVTALSPSLVSRVDELIRVDLDKKRKSMIMLSAAALIALAGFVYLAFFFGRNPKLEIILEKETGQEEVVDLSQTDRKEIPIAALEIKNIRKISKRRLEKKFTMDLHFQLHTALETLDHLKLKEGSGFSIKRNHDQQEFEIRRDDNILKGVLENINVGDKFKLFFHAQHVEDLAHAEPRKTKADFSLTLVKVSGKYDECGKDVRVKPVEKKETGEAKKLDIPVTFKPRTKETEIKLGHSSGDSETFCTKQEKHILPYSRKNPVSKVFSVTVTDKNLVSFAGKTEGVLTLEVKEDGNKIEQNPGFYFGAGEDSLDLKNDGIPVFLKEGENRTVDCFVDYRDFGKNPMDPRNFYVRCLFNREEFPGTSANVEITRSDERTEAIIAVEVDGKPTVFEKEDHLKVDVHGRLLLNEEIDEHEITASVYVRDMEPLAVKGYTGTELCTVKFSNGCTTGTGLFEWNLEDITLEKNHVLSFDDRWSSRIITALDDHVEGEVEDVEESYDEIVLSLYPEHINFRNYELPLNIITDWVVRIYPDGKGNKEKNIRLRLHVKINGFHDVLPNYSIIDFGSSAISAAQYDYSLDESKRMNKLHFNSPKGHLKGGDGFLPSIVNLVEHQYLGSKEFLDLPAIDKIITENPGYMITSLKLKILEGLKQFPLPPGFKFKGKDGKPSTDETLPMKELLLSAYRNLRHNYLGKDKFDPKKYIFTCPNIYTRSHQAFLSEILAQVFAEHGQGVYKENIQLVSESDAVLFYYIKIKAGEDLGTRNENVVIVDIGASTMDITLAEIQWKKEKDITKVDKVKIINRDGMTMAGETLDKAIAYQVHDVVKEYDEPEEKHELVEKIGEESSPDEKTGFLDDDPIYSGKEVMGNELKVTPKTEKPNTAPIEKPTADTSNKRYANPIVRGTHEAANIKLTMFNFKQDNILQFKKDIAQSGNGNWVEICLREHTNEKGLIWNFKGKENRKYYGKGFAVDTSLELKGDGKCYLGMQYEDWLKLPFIKRFKELFEQKIKDYREAAGWEAFKNATVILSGRTTLWPSIPVAIKNVIGTEPVDIWPEDSKNKASALKSAVIEGAIYKAIYLNHVPFEKVEINGIPAVSYEKNGSVWDEVVLTLDRPVEIDLEYSASFKIGMKTALGFLHFMSCETIFRDNLTNAVKKIKIHTRKSDNEIGYDFLIESDKHEKPRPLVRDPRLEKHFPSSRRKNWPIEIEQLQDIKPEDFSEQI